MGLILPTQARTNSRVWRWLQDLIARNRAIRKLVPVEIGESMANGGGPACLRLRVVADPTTVDPRFLVDVERLTLIEATVHQHWPEEIAPDDLASPGLWHDARAARSALLDVLGLGQLA
jgi:succinylarginine dihydrolase